MGHLFMSLMVAINVAITLVNVAGYIGFWGLNLDVGCHISHDCTGLGSRLLSPHCPCLHGNARRQQEQENEEGCVRNGASSVQWRLLYIPGLCPSHDVTVLRVQELLQDILSRGALWAVPWTCVSASCSKHLWPRVF